MIEYKGKKYEEFHSDKPVVFEEPVKAILWNDKECNITEGKLLAFLPTRGHPAIAKWHSWSHCALVTPSRRATKRELSMWLAKGNGEVCRKGCNSASPCYAYDPRESNEKVPDQVLIRKWHEEEWQDPTTDYMGLDE